MSDMGRVLFIDSCVRAESRTKRLAAKLLEKIGGETATVDLPSSGLKPLTKETLERREKLIGMKDFTDPMFDLAKSFADADVIVMAAPYWDLSFPSALKVFIEHISVRGITFTYTDDGAPVGLCRAKKLWYVTTMGGAGLPYDFGYEYVKAVSSSYYGIHDAELIAAEGLDLVGNDPEAILENVLNRI